jgi:hypothetical protein
VEVTALVVYNLAFIVPLVLVFLVVYFGVSSDRIGAWFAQRTAATKVIMGAVFLLLGVAIWFV